MRITQEDYEFHRDNYNGICTTCSAIRHGETEPDAENYECEECNEQSVMGIDNALISGILEIVDED